jgi:hypothetical protein
MPKGKQLILFDRDLQASPRVVSPLGGGKAMVQEELDDALGLFSQFQTEASLTLSLLATSACDGLMSKRFFRRCSPTDDG